MVGSTGSGSFALAKTIVHILAQRPGHTGSGVTLDAIVRHAQSAGWDQWIAAAIADGDSIPEIGGLPPGRFRPLVFERQDLDFAIPGMSDVMPYRSTRFSSMNERQIAVYKRSWRRLIRKVVAEVKPDLIQSHHVWMLGALLKDAAPGVPVVTYCHGTGLRQMALCPHLAKEVKEGCATHDGFLALHKDHAGKLQKTLGISPQRIHIVGAGYRPELFFRDDSVRRSAKSLLYIGKYSAAKGLPQLLDAVERLGPKIPGFTLHVAGSGAGSEADAIQKRMEAMPTSVIMHGQLSQPDLADLMRRCAVCVLPSFFEGLPLVLIEAAACGCRLIATQLPGIALGFAGRLGANLRMVPPPRLIGPDTPTPEDVPAFVDALANAIEESIVNPSDSPVDLSHFTMQSLFKRVEAVWNGVLS
jgi:alpha-maltose-1-phosphate synthase